MIHLSFANSAHDSDSEARTKAVRKSEMSSRRAPDEQLPDERVLDADALAQQRNELVHVKVVTRRHHVFDQPICGTRTRVDDAPMARSAATIREARLPSSCAPFLTSMSTSAYSCALGKNNLAWQKAATKSWHLAQPVKDLVEEQQHVAASDLQNVAHCARFRNRVAASKQRAAAIALW